MRANDLVFILGDAKTAAFLSGAGQVAAKVPRVRTNPVARGLPARAHDFGRWDWKGMKVWLPLIEKAADDLEQKRLLTRAQFDTATDEIRRDAFTSAYAKTEEGVGAVRDAVLQAVADGTGQKEFRAAIEEKLGKSAMGPGEMENTLRTGVMTQYAAGMDKILANPIVGPLFPYERVLWIDDGRITDLCYTIAHSGISSDQFPNGSPIYRSDDPVIRYFRFPRHHQDRCSRRMMTIEDAAAAGIVEAQKRLETGRWPAVLAHVPWPTDPETKGPLQLSPNWTPGA